MRRHRRIAAIALLTATLVLPPAAAAGPTPPAAAVDPTPPEAEVAAPMAADHSSVAASATTSATPVHPRLIFSAADVPGLRQRVTSGVHAQAWALLREKAEGHLLLAQPEAIRARLIEYNGQNQLNTYLINLGLAYQLSGDLRYGRRAVDLMIATAEAGFPFWSGQDLGIGDLMEGYGLAIDWTYELMTPAERSYLVGRMTEYQDLLFVRPIYRSVNVAASNWVGVTGGGAGLALLALRGEPGAPADLETYLADAHARVGSFLDAGFDPAGAGLEGYVYAQYGLKNAVPYALAARREGLGDLITGSPAAQVARWAVYETIPGEGHSMLPLNDSSRVQVAAELPAYAFALAPDDGVTQWFWQRTIGPRGDDYFGRPRAPIPTNDTNCSDLARSPFVNAYCSTLINNHSEVWHILFYKNTAELPEVDPATVQPRSRWFQHRGLVDVRSGWAGGADEVVSSFEAARSHYGAYGLHRHEDAGSFTFYGRGGHWAVDPGYACCNNPDTRRASTHNVVLVNNTRYTQTDTGWAGQTIDGYVDMPNFTWSHADLRHAYVNPTPPYAQRDHFLVRAPGRPAILAVTDHLDRGYSAVYTWQLHTDYRNSVGVLESAFTMRAPSGATVTGRTARAGGEPTVLVRADAWPTTPDGTVAAPEIYTETPNQRTLDHLAVMAVTRPGEREATTTTLAVQGGNAIVVGWNGLTDLVAARHAAASRIVSPLLDTDGSFVALTEDRGEALLVGGTELVFRNRTYVQVSGGAATVAVSGDRVQAAGPSGASYRVFSPQPIASVTVNGAAVSSCRDGEDLRFPCAGGT